MKDKIIQTITFKLGGKESTVSKEDAKKLYVELHELFGEKTVTLPPVYVERERYRTTPSWMPDIICHSGPGSIAHHFSREADALAAARS